MARNDLVVEIRSEFKKGFGDVAKAFTSLEKELKNIGKLTESINKLSTTMDKNLGLKNAQQGLKKVAKGQKDVNVSLNEGVKIAQQYATAQSKLEDRLGKVAAAQKSGHITEKARRQAEIGLISEYIKKTKDLTILEKKRLQPRYQGAFTGLSSGVMNELRTKFKPIATTVEDVVAKSVDKGVAKAATRSVNQLVGNRSTIQRAIGVITTQGARYNSGFSNRNHQSTFYEQMFGGGGIKTQTVALNEFINRMTGVTSATQTDTGFNKMKLALLEAQNRELAKIEAQTDKVGRANARARQAGNIQAAVRKILGQGSEYEARGFTNRNEQAAFYDFMWREPKQPRKAGPEVQTWMDRVLGVRTENSLGLLPTGNDKADAAKVRYLTQQEKANERLANSYDRLARRAQAVSTRISRMPFAPNPAKSEAAINKMITGYTKLGHVLFQLQYSTITLFTATGLVAMTQQIDKFITLRNQVARTSDSIKDLGANMDTVYGISMRTFSDANVVGNMFSRVNKYSEALGLSREQVGGVTEAIAGAFAASPGNAQEKAASMYQFMQGFQSNRMGGDELRSVLEMAPFVGDILGKGLAKIRGMPEGSVVDLRQQGELGTPVNTRDLAAIFSDPAIQAEIRRVLGEQARTFGDVMQLGKTRLLQLTEQFVYGTGVITPFIKSLASFISNDENLEKFGRALVAATVALTTYSGVLAAKGAAGALGNVAGGLGARLGLGMSNTMTSPVGAFGPVIPQRMSNAQFNKMYRQAHTDNISRSVSGVGKSIGSGFTNTMLGLGTALDLLSTKADKTGKVVGPVGKAFDGVKNGAGLAVAGLGNMNRSVGKAAATGQLGSKLFQGLGSVLGRVGPLVLSIAGFFTTLSLPLIAIAAVIGALVARFNHLLGKMTGGMNIIDILRGTWVMLTDAMSGLAKYVQESFVGKIFGAFTGFIDNILKFLGRAAAGNEVFQAMQASRQLDKNSDGQAVVDYNGQRWSVRLNERGQYERHERLADNTVADFKWGERVTKNNPNLPSGHKSNLPESANTGKNAGGGHERKDPWPEFLRDLKLKIQGITDTLDLTPAQRDIQGDLNDNIRRAMDVMDFDSSGYETLAQAWESFSKENVEKAERVNKLNGDLKNLRLVEITREFMNTIADELADARLAAINAGVSDLDAEFNSNRNSMLRRYLDSNHFTGNQTDRSEILDYLRNGQLAGATRLLQSNMSESSNAEFDRDREDLDNTALNNRLNGHRRENSLARESLENYRESLKVFGQQRELQNEINSITESYQRTYGENLSKYPELLGMMQQEIDLAKERAQIQKDYNANWVNGAMEAITAYKEGLENFAADANNLFSNVFKGIEDQLVNAITTGKFEIHDLLTTLQGDMARMTVRQLVMKPITNMFEGLFGGLLEEDKVIQAKNVYVNGTEMGGMLGGKGDPLGLGNIFGKGEDGKGGFLKNLFGGSGAEGEGGGFFSSLFKGGGNFLSSLFSGAKGGFGKILGMVGNFLPPPFNMISKLFSFFHGGGTVGAATDKRFVNPSVFAGARRYHTGGTAGMPALAVGEVPAILKQGEKVLTASQYSAMNSKPSTTTFSPQISLTVNNQGGVGDAASGQDNSKLIADMVAGAVNEALFEYDKQSRRPGSPQYLAGRR